jgi:hypothetical protein
VTDENDAPLRWGRVLKNGWVASLEGSVPIIKDYPVYDFKIEGRVQFSY